MKITNQKGQKHQMGHTKINILIKHSVKKVKVKIINHRIKGKSHNDDINSIRWSSTDQ